MYNLSMMNAMPFPSLAAPDFAVAELAPSRPLLDPLLQSGTLGLLYGPAGVGKSLVALGIAWAVASGGSFLGWRAERPHKVFYVEGEMAPAETQRRLALFGRHPPTLEVLLPVLDK